MTRTWRLGRTIRWVAGLAMLATPLGAVHAQDAPSEATIAAHKAAAASLTLDDAGDMANATRGRIASIADGLITGPDGRVVWDWRPYAFLDAAEPPPSVHPSLWRQARLNRVHGLFEVVPGAIWQVRGYDLSVMTVVRGKTGWIVIDPLTTEETAAAAWKLFVDTVPGARARPIRAMLFTHSHSDHFGGVGGILPADGTGQAKVRIIAPHGFSAEATAENVMAGPAMSRRATYQFGQTLAPGPLGQVDNGLGPRLPVGTIGYREPTETVPQSGGRLTIDGLRFDFIDAGGTEAPAEFIFHIPAYRALHMAEVATRTLHNILTLRGAEVRDALHWSQVIDAALQRFGASSDVALASHGWPTWGGEPLRRWLTGQRNIYRYIHDRTLGRANAGATLHEVAEGVPPPAVQAGDAATRDYYGTTNHNMKATYQKYFGWWDGVPANFNPVPPEDAARRYVALIGGPDRVLAAGRAAMAAGEYRWAAELFNRLVFADPAFPGARDALASAYDQLGYQSESGIWRNYYLTASATLRGREQSRALSNQSLAYVRAIPTLTFFDALATRFDAVRGRAINGTFQFILPDTGEAVAVEVAGGVEFPRLGVRDPAALATVTVDRAALNELMSGAATFPALMMAGRVAIAGDRAAFLGWFTLHPPADPQFNVVMP